MMLKALLKVRLAAFGAYFTGASRSRRRQSKVQKIGMLALMLYALAAFGMLFYTSFSAIAGIYAHEGFGWLYFAMYAIMAFALMVFGSVFTAKAQLYEAKDNELLLSMPIAPRAILASRMASLWLLNLIFGLVVAVPAALAWAQAAALPVLGWVSIVLLLPALDFFSLAVTSLLASMALTSRRSVSLLPTSEPRDRLSLIRARVSSIRLRSFAIKKARPAVRNN